MEMFSDPLTHPPCLKQNKTNKNKKNQTIQT